jgi:predicted dehydrogenase
LLDVGIYCVAPILQAGGGPPVRTIASAQLGGDGVDATFHGRLEFASGMVGDILCSFEMAENQLLLAFGAAAAIVVERPFTPGHDDRTYRVGDRVVETGGSNCYRGMVDHFCDVVRARADLCRPPQDSIELLEVLDGLRSAAGVSVG